MQAGKALPSRRSKTLRNAHTFRLLLDFQQYITFAADSLASDIEYCQLLFTFIYLFISQENYRVIPIELLNREAFALHVNLLDFSLSMCIPQ